MNECNQIKSPLLIKINECRVAFFGWNDDDDDV